MGFEPRGEDHPASARAAPILTKAKKGIRSSLIRNLAALAFAADGKPAADHGASRVHETIERDHPSHDDQHFETAIGRITRWK